jgi:hypothetical protein
MASDLVNLNVEECCIVTFLVKEKFFISSNKLKMKFILQLCLCFRLMTLWLQRSWLFLWKAQEMTVEGAIAFLKECGMKLMEVSNKGILAIFEILHNILHERQLDKRVSSLLTSIFIENAHPTSKVETSKKEEHLTKDVRWRNMLPPSSGLESVGICFALQQGCMEYGHPDPWKELRKWSLIWASGKVI